MLEFLVDETKVSVTHLLLDRLEEIVDSGSSIVNEFLDKSFIITDQFSEPRPLHWKGSDKEKFFSVPTSYITEAYLKRLV